MTLALIFNERSLHEPAPDRLTARQWMTEFVRMLIAATSSEYSLNVLRTHATFAEMSLAPDYPMSAWFNDREVSKDAQEFILTYATQHKVIRPYIDGLATDDETRLRSDRFIGSYDGEFALGLGFAYLLDGLGISLISEPCWDASEIQINRLEESPDSDDLIEDVVSVHHSARIIHLERHKAWIAERNKNSVRDGKDLLRKAPKWFPHLVFSETAKKQLGELGRADLYLPRIVDRLFELDRSYGMWKPKGYDIENLLQNGSHESKETIQEFGKTREFRDTKGIPRLCEMHLKLKTGQAQWRIHFWPDNENEMGFTDGRKFLVGYIGPHLETKNGF